jgi:hypoxanthine-DNA glycosylase
LKKRAGLQGLAPLIDTRAETLVLGSFPSVKSLAAQEYYAHPQNHFWKIMASLAGRPFAGMPYPERVRAVMDLRIGIWDVVGACEREGSGDERIENAEPNDFAALAAMAPRLARVCFNGKAAEKIGAPLFSGLPYQVLALPSTSPRNARMPLAEKIRIWSNAITDAGA